MKDEVVKTSFLKEWFEEVITIDLEFRLFLIIFQLNYFEYNYYFSNILI